MELSTIWNARSTVNVTGFGCVAGRSAHRLHGRNAMARWNQTDFESTTAKEEARRKILASAKRHGIEVDPSDKIAKG